MLGVSNSLYADAVDDLQNITVLMTNCYNKNTSKGLLVFGGMNIHNDDSLRLLRDYLIADCSYESIQIGTILTKYGITARKALLMKSCSLVLINIADSLTKKANDFDEKFESYVREIE